ncbi:microcystin-dependent protein [Aurantimicrobium minutum]|nr:microcystin-dependent protein [Aurantimicrobium minutum]
MDIGDYVISGQKNGSLEFGSIGKTYGEKTHLQTVAEMASHTHIQDSHSHSLGLPVMPNEWEAANYGAQYGGGFANRIVVRGGTWGAGTAYGSTATNQYSGGNTPFNVIQPTRTALIVIKT